MTMRNYLTSLLALPLLVAVGCQRARSKPPTGKLALTVRFFQSIAAKDTNAAVRQGEKLYAADPRQDYILQLVSIQESNETVANAQKLIRAGRITQALPVVTEAIKQYPNNRMLAASYPKIAQLRSAEKLLIAMKNARTASAMRGARVAARAGLSRNLTPVLTKYLEAYEKREQLVAKQEQESLEKAGKRAETDAKAVKAADDKRAEADRQFQQSTSKKTAEGERIRREAGAIPFEPGEQRETTPAPAAPSEPPTESKSAPTPAAPGAPVPEKPAS